MPERIQKGYRGLDAWLEVALQNKAPVVELSGYLKCYFPQMLPFLRRHAECYLNPSLARQTGTNQELGHVGVFLGSCLRNTSPQTIARFMPDTPNDFADCFVGGILRGINGLRQVHNGSTNLWYGYDVLDLRKLPPLDKPITIVAGAVIQNGKIADNYHIITGTIVEERPLRLLD